MAPFPYFHALSPQEQHVYRMSDALPVPRLARPALPRFYVGAVREALLSGERLPLERATTRLLDALCAQLGLPPPRVEVLDVRPVTAAEGELHGLYGWEPGQRPHVHVWMRTARHARVVAFRTYLRTVLHELCHHLDFQLLELGASFHTEGFFRRESGLFAQLLPEAPPPARPPSWQGCGGGHPTPETTGFLHPRHRSRSTRRRRG
ncbi:hypothetical protein LZ198_12900 [Myxococcus sp. K15C18031901]|uniref:hypothetical protein n=1 Tax=Myxococcus dinghuensis TaxID=2906761 RepID=UPI0020A7F6A7|nr:hypothetical protein [Myxococcus dinghuensis]MCP3099766.1 hypothetical protein [Myxococcus dinghuensis]